MANTIQLEKLAIEEENRNLRDTNFELQSKTRAAETTAKRVQIEVADKEKQLRIMTDQNSELLRLLEGEESLTSRLQGEVAELRSELDELRQKYTALLATAKTHEELATKAAKEGQLRAEEIRLLRVETEQLKQQNTELKMKTQVEVEALQEQLRVRKEKQYQLLEKLQAQEEAKRQAEDQVAGMEEQLRGLHARNADLETQNKVESRSKSNVEEANKELQIENNNLMGACKELQSKIDRSEKERLRMEAEARDSSLQVQEMAEKIFQVLERLKLAELGKTKAMEALKKKELDMVTIQKKNARLSKDTADEGKARVEAELNIKTLQEQLRGLKKNNTSLAQKSKEEAEARCKVMEERDQLDEKLKTMESRLSFLLNKVQADSEVRVIQVEDRKKLEAQVMSYSEKCEELQNKLTEMGESNRIITQALRLKQEEISSLELKYRHAMQELGSCEKELAAIHGTSQALPEPSGDDGPRADDIDHVRQNEGRGRFYVEAHSIGGGSLLLLKARKTAYKDWLDKFAVNDFLKRSQKTTRFRDMVVEKFAAVYGLLMVEEEEKNQILAQITTRDQHIDMQQRKLGLAQDSLAAEEEAKRRMLLRYIHAVKEHAMATGAGGTGGILQLPESNLGDEEIHALSALLRNNVSIEEVNLRGNLISDDGARALAAVLSGRSGLRLLDLRGNKISRAGIKALAEALERSGRVKHVYVHAGGKVEALGTKAKDATAGAPPAAPSSSTQTSGAVETVCVVDVRDNSPESTTVPYVLDKVADPAQSLQDFRPLQLVDSNSSGKLAPKTDMAPKRKGPGKALAKSMGSFPLSSEAEEIEKKKKQVAAHEEQLKILREAQWKGRSAGRDTQQLALLDGTYFNNFMGDPAAAGPGTNPKKQKKHNQRQPLPPLNNNASADIGGPDSRSQSAPDGASYGLELLDLHPEQLMRDSAPSQASPNNVTAQLAQILGPPHSDGKDKKKKKAKKMSETEKRLMNRCASVYLL